MSEEVWPGYKRTEVGVIPEEWEVTCVGDSFDVCNELRLPISQSVREGISGPYPYYGPTNVQGWINEYRVEGEYALIGEDGDHFLKWQNQSMTLLVRGKFNVNNHAHLVRGTKNLTEWFYWFFANRDLTPYLTRQGASRYKLKKSTLLQISCALPPLPEQHAIAEALSDVDALLGALNRLIAKKRDLKQAAMQQLLTGQTRLPGFHGEWEVKRLGDLASLINGRAYSLLEWESNGTPVIRLQNLTGRGEVYYYSNLALPDKQYCQTGDLLFMWSATFGPIIWLGPTAIFHYHIWKIECWKNRLDKIFLYHYLYDVTEKLKRSSTSGGTMLHLTKSGMEAMEMAVPEYDEQTAIAAVLSDMDAELTTLEQRRNKTQALKQGMMQELLTGKTRLLAPGAFHA